MDEILTTATDLVTQNLTEESLMTSSLNATLGSSSVDGMINPGASSGFTAIISFMDVYVTPVIIVVGVAGNTCCFVVYVATPHLWRQSSSVYLAFFAAVNSGFLVSLFFVWISWEGMQVFHKTGWCQTTRFVKDVCYFLSAWTVVSFTVERWIVVYLPLKRHRLCTRRRAVTVMLLLTVFALCFYSHDIWTTTSVRYGNFEVCITSGRREFKTFLDVVKVLDVILVVCVPLLGIIVLSSLIGIKICRYTSPRPPPHRTSTTGARNAGPGSGYAAAPSRSRYDSYELSSHMGSRTAPSHVSNMAASSRTWRVTTRRHVTQLRITRALLIVSTVFVILTFPSSAMKINTIVIDLSHRKFNPPAAAILWYQLIELLNYVNFSSNFFLLSACSRSFRHALKRMLRRFWRKLRNCTARRFNDCCDALSSKSDEY